MSRDREADPRCHNKHLSISCTGHRLKKIQAPNLRSWSGLRELPQGSHAIPPVWSTCWPGCSCISSSQHRADPEGMSAGCLTHWPLRHCRARRKDAPKLWQSKFLVSIFSLPEEEGKTPADIQAAKWKALTLQWRVKDCPRTWDWPPPQTPLG